ncbi:hypothetical protein P4123_15805 [Pseudomonas aeruginosa]|nr:hypothetical protein [Pseudomonas aeruginosa]
MVSRRSEVDPLAERQRHHLQRDGDPARARNSDSRLANSDWRNSLPAARRRVFSVSCSTSLVSNRLLHEGIRARTA